MKATREIFFRRLSSEENRRLNDLGLLVLRLVAGLTMAAQHGIGKLQNLLNGNVQFPDPIGIGAPTSLFLTGMTEFFCAMAVSLGVLTRLMSIPLAFTMMIAAFVVHANDSFERKELAILYLVIFFIFILTGPGRYSVDAKILRNKR
ncbi:MAG: DoxX family protein [bacterium]